MYLKNTLSTLILTFSLSIPLSAQFELQLLGLRIGAISQEETKELVSNSIIFILPPIDETEYNKFIKKGKTIEAQSITAQKDSIIAQLKGVAPEFLTEEKEKAHLSHFVKFILANRTNGTFSFAPTQVADPSQNQMSRFSTHALKDS